MNAAVIDKDCSARSTAENLPVWKTCLISQCLGNSATGVDSPLQVEKENYNLGFFSPSGLSLEASMPDWNPLDLATVVSSVPSALRSISRWGFYRRELATKCYGWQGWGNLEQDVTFFSPLHFVLSFPCPWFHSQMFFGGIPAPGNAQLSHGMELHTAALSQIPAHTLTNKTPTTTNPGCWHFPFLVLLSSPPKTREQGLFVEACSSSSFSYPLVYPDYGVPPSLLWFTWGVTLAFAPSIRAVRYLVGCSECNLRGQGSGFGEAPTWMYFCLFSLVSPEFIFLAWAVLPFNQRGEQLWGVECKYI